MKDDYRKLLLTLNDASFSAYITGGMARDYFLGRESKDVDIATSATPPQVKALFGDQVIDFVGAHFGVSLVKTDDGETAEIATFRTDGCYADSRHPSDVAYTNDAREDAKRRDFTMNALFIDAHEKVLDYQLGRRDIGNRIVRAIGDPWVRFREDALRMMRAVRFACQLDFSIDSITFEAIKENSHRIRQISKERIAGELNKILTSGRADRGIELLSECGLLVEILPEIEALKACPQSKVWHPEGDVFVHTMRLLKGLEPGCSLTLALGALLHDVGKPAALAFKEDGEPTAYGHEDLGEPIAGTILSRLKYPNDVIEAVRGHVRQHMTFSTLPQMRRAKQMRFIASPNFAELLELHRLDTLAGAGVMTGYTFAASLLEQTSEEEMRPVPFITGYDLIGLRLKPGPLFKHILGQVMEGQLEGTITSRRDALSEARLLAALDTAHIDAIVRED